MSKFVKCGICNAIIPQHETDKWVYHVSFPRGGVACRHHYGVMKEYERLIKEANQRLIELGIAYND